MDDPLRHASRELISAREATERMCSARDLGELNAEWASVLNHLEKLWVKTLQAGLEAEGDFRKWNRPWQEIKRSDPLLNYLTQARHADNHSTQDLASFVTGHITIQVGKGMSFEMLEEPELAIDQVKNRGVKFTTPETHLGEQVTTRDPRNLAVHACNFYADYLDQVRATFFGNAS
ncbi:MAG: hypothetical protein ABI128_00635 [Rhodanobacter sp.]